MVVFPAVFGDIGPEIIIVYSICCGGAGLWCKLLILLACIIAVIDVVLAADFVLADTDYAIPCSCDCMGNCV